jgi:hypothetical protein
MNKLPINLPAFGSAIAGQGGIFAAIMRGRTVDGVQQPPYALLVSDATVGEIEAVTWGEYNKDVPGTSSRTDGKANTDAMVLANCPAGLRVREISIEGHTDYFLPAIGQLNSAAANVPELFSKEGYYWTSTQGSRIFAFVQDFELGGSDWSLKDSERRVRAFRAIPLELLNT